MANFKDSPHFSTHDDYYTPKSVYEMITPFIDREKIKKIYDCCCLNSNGQSLKYIEEMDFQAVGSTDWDYLEEREVDYDLIFTNPPFQRVDPKNMEGSLKVALLSKIVKQSKPFIVILNSTNIHSKWFSRVFGDMDIQFIIPTKKINYDKYEKGGKVKVAQKKNGCSFNTIFVTRGVIEKNMWI